MEQKKSFFASLDSKSALIVGLVTGILVLCTIGFLVMLGLYLKGGNKSDTSDKVTPVANVNQGDQATAPVAVTKSDRPKVELFVMAYCPYGLQMEKAYLPAWNLLKNKADMDIKFVSYAMHGLKELEENTRQYCIQQNQPAKIITYLQCFTGKDDYKSCLSQAGISEGSLSSCINATNAKYKTLDKFKDQTTWLSGRYPVYPVQEDLNTKYDVQGSPSLVINGALAEGVGRTADAVKQAICAAFNNPPAECGTTLASAAYGAGFGYDASGDPSAAAACGN
ncbi:MAG: hypothetical protein WCT11_02010 [Candidatus Magasanikbacteria bacterium]|jgi:hypothetical protein